MRVARRDGEQLYILYFFLQVVEGKKTEGEEMESKGWRAGAEEERDGARKEMKSCRKINGIFIKNLFNYFVSTCHIVIGHVGSTYLPHHT